MWTCKLCGVEYEPHRDRSIVCRPCHDRVRALPAQALTVAERLWGKCFARGDCWEYGTPSPEGRPGKLMMSRRQSPAAQVALLLAGVARPSEKHVAHADCRNKMCVQPEHLSWVKWIGGSNTSPWSHGISAESIAEMTATIRAKRAAYQKRYRSQLKALGARTMTEHHEDRARAELEARGVIKPDATEYRPAPLAQPAPLLRVTDPLPDVADDDGPLVTPELLAKLEQDARAARAIRRAGEAAAARTKVEEKPAPSFLDALAGAKVDATD